MYMLCVSMVGIAAVAVQASTASFAQAESSPPTTIPGGSSPTITIPPRPTTPATIPPPPPCSTTLSADVLFAYDSSQLSSPGTAVLQHLARAHQLTNRRNRGVRIRIIGHTDSDGSDQYNLDLSRRRAAAVKDVFVQVGVAAARVQAEGVGKTKPAVTPEVTDADKAANRRVEIQLIKSNGKPACQGEL